MIDTQRTYRDKPFPLPLLSNTFDYDTLISWLPLAIVMENCLARGREPFF
jgi:hypothetical protein